MIEGVKLIPRRRIPDVRGTIMHGIRIDELENEFGEVYFKKLHHGIINGWHVHETLILNYICISGTIRLVLFDLREDSPTYRTVQEVVIGDDNYILVHIPPGIANASESLLVSGSILCNIASEPHKPDLKYKRIDPLSNIIPFNWNNRHF